MEMKITFIILKKDGFFKNSKKISNYHLFLIDIKIVSHIIDA
jgi:hypothetical protein